MTFLDMAALSIAPVLIAILAAALILPRTWLAFYVAIVTGTAIVYAEHGGRHDDAAMDGLLSVLLGMLMMAALAAGLATRWVLKARSPQN